MTQHPISKILGLLLAILLGGLLSSCAAQQPRSEEPLNQSRWGELERSLPAGSPIVAQVKGQELLTRVKFVLDWFAAEPENWGAEGASMIRLASLYWQLFASTAGGDPTDIKTWHGVGIDAARPVVLAVYPVFQDAWMDSMEAGEQPKDKSPVLGIRVIIPTHTQNVFQNFVSDVFQTAGYTSTETGFYAPGDDALPWVHVNIGPTESELDLVFISAEDHSTGESRRVAGTSELKRALELARGAPDAPVFAQDGLVSISVNQKGAAAIARARGYIRALSLAHRVSATERSAYLSKLVNESIRSSQAFEARAKELPGTRYSLNASGFSMDLILEQDAPDMRSSARPGIGVLESDVGLMMDARPYRDGRARYLKLEDAGRALEFVGAEDRDPIFWVLTFLRSLALVSGNLLDAAPEAFSEPWAGLVRALDHAEVLEISLNQNLQTLAWLKDLPADRSQDAAREVAIFFQFVHAMLNGQSSPEPTAGVTPGVIDGLGLANGSAKTLFMPSKGFIFIQEGDTRRMEPNLELADQSGDDYAFLRA